MNTNEPNKPAPLCKHCRYFRNPMILPDSCRSPNNGPDLVNSGNAKELPAWNRKEAHLCGPAGAWFEGWTSEEIKNRKHR